MVGKIRNMEYYQIIKNFDFVKKLLDHSDTTGKIIDLITATATIFACFVALYIGKNVAKSLSFHNKTVEYEYQEIKKLLDLLDSINFSIYGSYGMEYYLKRIYYPSGTLDKELKESKDFVLSINFDLFIDKTSSILALSNSFFIPNEIKCKLIAINDLNLNSKRTTDNKSHNYLILEKKPLIYITLAELSKFDEFFLKSNGELLTLNNFINIWDELILEINNWFKKNGIKKQVIQYPKYIEQEKPISFNF